MRYEFPRVRRRRRDVPGARLTSAIRRSTGNGAIRPSPRSCHVRFCVRRRVAGSDRSVHPAILLGKPSATLRASFALLHVIRKGFTGRPHSDSRHERGVQGTAYGSIELGVAARGVFESTNDPLNARPRKARAGPPIAGWLRWSRSAAGAFRPSSMTPNTSSSNSLATAAKRRGASKLPPPTRCVLGCPIPQLLQNAAAVLRAS